VDFASDRNWLLCLGDAKLQLLFLGVGHRLTLDLGRNLLKVLLSKLHSLHLEVVLVFPCQLGCLVRLLPWSHHLLLFPSHLGHFALTRAVSWSNLLLLVSLNVLRVVPCFASTLRISLTLSTIATALRNDNLLVTLTPIEGRRFFAACDINHGNGSGCCIRITTKRLLLF
jgi:hypothetical protein